MKYIDVSAKTDPSLKPRRTVRRRGIVIHTTMGYDSLSWLQRDSIQAGRPASADFLIARNGDIYQITEPGTHAWHTGRARWRTHMDQDGSLSHSYVGIEIESAEHRGQYMTSLQYIACAALVRKLVQQHGIGVDNIVGHWQVAMPRGRKQDPMKFDTAVFAQELLSPSKEARELVFPAVLP